MRETCDTSTTTPSSLDHTHQHSSTADVHKPVRKCLERLINGTVQHIVHICGDIVFAILRSDGLIQTTRDQLHCLGCAKAEACYLHGSWGPVPHVQLRHTHTHVQRMYMYVHVCTCMYLHVSTCMYYLHYTMPSIHDVFALHHTVHVAYTL